MAKSPDAFRTISEVSAWLETPPHVLRFWESKFPQVKPVKRAGGRRYYRPEDIALLGGIKVLLHEQGMTIRGVQKMLREQGVRHVASLSAQVWTEDGSGAAALDGGADEGLDETLESEFHVLLDGEEVDDVGNGVIVGPWGGREDGPDQVGPEMDAAEEDQASLAALDGRATEGIVANLETADDERRRDADGRHVVAAEALGVVPDEAVEPPTLVGAFLAGTMSRLAADTPVSRDAAEGIGGLDPKSMGHVPPSSSTLGKPTLNHALALLRRADPDRLRARADRIAPLLQRLRALREQLPHRSA